MQIARGGKRKGWKEGGWLSRDQPWRDTNKARRGTATQAREKKKSWARENERRGGKKEGAIRKVIYSAAQHLLYTDGMANQFLKGEPPPPEHLWRSSHPFIHFHYVRTRSSRKNGGVYCLLFFVETLGDSLCTDSCLSIILRSIEHWTLTIAICHEAYWAYIFGARLLLSTCNWINI